MDNTLTFRYSTALTIAGSDNSGGAGIQADLKTFSALGVYGMSALTAVTAQNTQGVRGIQSITPEIIKDQLEAIFEDITVDAVKTGMLHNKAAVLATAEMFDKFSPQYIITDPVMISTSGSRLMEDDAVETMIQELFPRVTLLTPNIDEAIFLSGIQIHNIQDMDRAAGQLLHLGCNAVLVKGGHLQGEYMTDRLCIKGHPPVSLENKTISTINTHGTGCTLSAAITAFLALGNKLPQAVTLSKEYISKALEAGSGIKTGKGHGPVNHFFAPVTLQKRTISCD